jgi:hypothetical protein
MFTVPIDPAVPLSLIVDNASPTSLTIHGVAKRPDEPLTKSIAGLATGIDLGNGRTRYHLGLFPLATLVRLQVGILGNPKKAYRATLQFEQQGANVGELVLLDGLLDENGAKAERREFTLIEAAVV